MGNTVCAGPRLGKEPLQTTYGKDGEQHPPPEVDWVHGYTHGKCAAHPHAACPTQDGGYLLVGDCTTYAGTGDVGTGQEWPEDLKRAILVIKTAKDGTMEWSLRFGKIGHNYGKFAVQLPDGTYMIGGVSSVTDIDIVDFPYVQRRVLLRVSTDGILMKETVFPSANPNQPGRRDGIMGLAAEKGITESGGFVLYATGYVGGEVGYDPNTGEYDDDPMFLINLGRTFVTKLIVPALVPGKKSVTDPEVEWYRPIDAGIGDTKAAFRQGMRLFIDYNKAQLAVLSSACVSEENYDAEFAALAMSLDGELRWSKVYPAHECKGSHPYAFCQASDGEYVLGGHALENGWTESEQGPAGRALKINPSNGGITWETRFKQPGLHMNTECYGVCLLNNCKGLLFTCGTGVMPDEHPEDPDTMKTWMVLNAHLAEETGALRWLKPYTERDAGQNNAGEFAISTTDGGAVVLVDSQSFGSPETGGNFALAKVAPFL